MFPALLFLLSVIKKPTPTEKVWFLHLYSVVYAQICVWINLALQLTGGKKGGAFVLESQEVLAPQVTSEIRRLELSRAELDCISFIQPTPKADQQYSEENRWFKRTKRFLETHSFCWRPPQHAGGKRSRGLPAGQLAWLPPSSLPAGRAAGQPRLPAGEGADLQKLKQIVLFRLKFCSVDILFQHGMKRNVNSPEFSTKQKCRFLANFRHELCARYCCCLSTVRHLPPNSTFISIDLKAMSIKESVPRWLNNMSFEK